MGYITVQNARDEGVTDPPYSDARVQAAIDLWSDYIDRACRQWFESRALTIFLDGTDCDTLWLPVPIIGVTELYINDSTIVLGTDFYNVHNSRVLPDDRQNPRLTMRRKSGDLFTRAALGTADPAFVKGHRNQKIVGTFGYLEPDDTTPKMIKRAVLLLLQKSLPLMYTSGIPVVPLAVGPIKREKTDGHEIEWSTTGGGGGLIDDIVQDDEIAAIIKQYRAPLGGGVPIAWGEY